MKIKRLITLIESLALTGLVSVGFSSWLIVGSNPSILTAGVNVEEVIDNNDYIGIKNTIFSDYNYSGNATNGTGGFYNDFVFSTEYSNTGVLEFDIEINFSKYKVEQKSSPSNIQLIFQIGYKEFYDDDGSIQAFDIISRALNSKVDSTQEDPISISYEPYYDGVNTSQVSYTKLDYVAYSSSVYYPTVSGKFMLNNVSSISKIVIENKVYFKLLDGFKHSDYIDLASFGIPFKIIATLENVS